MRRNILGLQANVWTEHIQSKKRLDYMIMPRLAALAESAWTGAGAPGYPDFERRLKTHVPLYDAWKIAYFNPFDPDATPVRISGIIDHRFRK